MLRQSLNDSINNRFTASTAIKYKTDLFVFYKRFELELSKTFLELIFQQMFIYLNSITA